VNQPRLSPDDLKFLAEKEPASDPKDLWQVARDQEFFRALDEYRVSAGALAPLGLLLENSGSLTAEDVRVRLKVRHPKHVTILQADRLKRPVTSRLGAASERETGPCGYDLDVETPQRLAVLELSIISWRLRRSSLEI